jgi:phenylpropionate dioxygenase-like ring-hydroxylating dioxygenase large terminal subunit
LVFIPTRGDLPVRFGNGIPNEPGIGPATIDADAYRDPSRFELERTRILNGGWQIICRSDQIPAPGDHHVWKGHGENIVITRREDGSLSGFHNVCQHRGASIVAKSGTGAHRFTCRWHNWRYDADGKVVGVPNRPDFDPEVLAGLCAPAIDVDEWGGWVWAVLAGAGAAGKLQDWIAAEVAADLGAFRMEGMKLVEKIEWEVNVNWKVPVEAFCEYYHAQALHRADAQDAKDVRESTIHVFGRDSMYFVPYFGVLEELRRTLDHPRHAVCVYHLFPTAVIQAQAAHTQLWRAVPLSVDKTRFEAWELRYDSDDPEYLAQVDSLWASFKAVVQEDVDEWEDVAAVRTSSAYSRNILSDRECVITHFHRVMDDMLADGDGLGLEPATRQ